MSRETTTYCDRCGSKYQVITVGLFSESYIDASGNHDRRSYGPDLCLGCVSKAIELLGEEKFIKFMGKKICKT